MYKIIILKFVKKICRMVQHKLKFVYESKEGARLFPLINKGKNKIGNTDGFYWRIFQAESRFVHGMTSDEEAEKLFSISSFQDLEGDIVEIGSWLGKSTIHLAKGCLLSGNGIVHACDTFKGNIGKESLYTAPLKKNESIFSRFKTNITKLNLEKYVQVHKMTSEKAAKKIKSKLRLIFIDGCHDYKFVSKDIKIWSKKLQKNGIIILDDFIPEFPGVIKAANENIILNKNFKVLVVYDSLLVAKKIA